MEQETREQIVVDDSISLIFPLAVIRLSTSQPHHADGYPTDCVGTIDLE